jgi:hypothetical protein
MNRQEGAQQNDNGLHKKRIKKATAQGKKIGMKN